MGGGIGQAAGSGNAGGAPAPEKDQVTTHATAHATDEIQAEVAAEISAAPLLARLAERLGARAAANAVFGEPVSSGGVTVIPVARVAFGLGGGGGRERLAGRTGEGLGVGGGTLARPAGFIEIRDGRAAFVAIHDRRPEMLYGAAAVLAALSTARLVRALTTRRR